MLNPIKMINDHIVITFVFVLYALMIPQNGIWERLGAVFGALLMMYMVFSVKDIFTKHKSMR